MLRYPMQAEHRLQQVGCIDHGQGAQRHHNDHHDDDGNFPVHFLSLDVFPPHKYARASRTVRRAAWYAGASVASTAPRTTTKIQMAIPGADTSSGMGVLRNKLPSPAPIAQVRAMAGMTATTQLTAAIKIPSNTTRRRIVEPDAPMAFITPNSRVRSMTLVLIVEPRPIKPTIPMVDAMSKITPTRMTECPSVDATTVSIERGS